MRIISLFFFWHFCFSLPKQNTEFKQFRDRFDEIGKKLKRDGWSFEVNKNSTNDTKSNWIVRILNIKTVFSPVSFYLNFCWSCFFFMASNTRKKNSKFCSFIYIVHWPLTHTLAAFCLVQTENVYEKQKRIKIKTGQ